MAQENLVIDQQKAGPWRSALVGTVFAADAAGNCLALATLCFGGALAAGLGLATALFLLGSAIATLILFRFGSFRQAMAIAQDSSISILAPAVILAASSVSGPTEARVATAFAVIGTSAMVSGAVFWTIGRLGLGRFVRMFPYPVLAGFLASSGYLLFFAAMSILTGKSNFSAMVEAANSPLVQLSLFPAMAMAAVLLIAMYTWVGPTPVLILVFLSVIGFHTVCALFGIDHAQAQDLGLLPKVGQSANASLSIAMLGMIDWAAVARTAPSIAAVVLLNLIGILLNTSGVELATGEDVDENRELRVTGAANLAIGIFGGLTSYLQSGATIICLKLHVQRGPMILGHCAGLLLACLMAPAIVALVPTFVPAALLMFIGLSMLSDWLLGTKRRLILIDWLIVGTIVLATAVLGILPAIAIGMLLALLGFAYASLSLPVIRYTTTIAHRRSIRDRSAFQNNLLTQEGDRVRILHLQGSLFFGSVEKLISSLRGFTTTTHDLSALIIDFSEVHSFDSSACAALEKLSHLMKVQGIDPHVTGVSPRLRAVFNRWGLKLAADGDITTLVGFRYWTSLNDALEHCETALLTALQPAHENTDIAQILFDLGRQNPRTADLIARMQRRKLEPADVLIAASDQTHDVFFLVSGRFGVHLPTKQGRTIRVRTIGQGAIVGEIAFLTGQPRNADVICEERAVVLCLAEAEIEDIEENDRDLAALMMAIFGRSLATKLAQSNNQLANIQAN